MDIDFTPTGNGFGFSGRGMYGFIGGIGEADSMDDMMAKIKEALGAFGGMVEQMQMAKEGDWRDAVLGYLHNDPEFVYDEDTDTYSFIIIPKLRQYMLDDLHDEMKSCGTIGEMEKRIKNYLRRWKEDETEEFFYNLELELVDVINSDELDLRDERNMEDLAVFLEEKIHLIISEPIMKDLLPSE